MRNYIEINSDLCKACNLCIEACPKQVIEIGGEINERGYRCVVPARNEDCIGCRQCAVICPDVAITVYREEDDV